MNRTIDDIIDKEIEEMIDHEGNQFGDAVRDFFSCRQGLVSLGRSEDRRTDADSQVG